MNDVTMISYTDIVIIIIVSIVYLLFIPLQLIIFPMKYYSVKDVIYSGNWKKATGALTIRFLFVLFVCWILWLFNKRDSIAIWGITIGSFLCTWPSIYNYQLFAFCKNKYKFLYLIACLVSIVFSAASAVMAIRYLLPSLYGVKFVYLFDNGGFQMLLSIIGLALPIGMRKIIKEDEQDNPYLVSDTLESDMYLTKRKIQFERDYIDQYAYEINEAAQKHSIPPELLEIVVQLEKTNRGAWNYQFGERIAVRFFPGLLIRKDATLGLTQISIKAAKGFFHMAPQRYLPEMLKPETSIQLCAYVLRNILLEYETNAHTIEDESFSDIYDDFRNYSDHYKCCLYIASNYICGTKDVLKKYILVYAELIEEATPVFFPENG